MDFIECELSQILLTESATAPQVIVLREKEGERAFPIHIGFFEALAINRHIHGEEMIRPMTHDLLIGVIEGMGGALKSIIINDIVEDQEGAGTFYGLLVIEQGDEEIEIDCRPSDAVALAVRTGCPIFVSEQVFDILA
ncbi:MAG: bifunctional nuclease family protein [Planctomycetes bacterium]|nr:bifunctional nuclease family protein [Planctomycetota bacterium]